MMQIVYFSQKKQLWTEIDSYPGEKVFITPSPAKADNLRNQLTGLSFEDVVTIAKFTSDLLGLLWDDDSRPQVKRKAELLLIFGILKNRYFPELGFEQFNQAYNLFSDLRSFTLNEEALTSVLDEQPEQIRKALNIFWQLLEISGFSDEHAAYQKITEKLRSEDEKDELKKTFIFWGFQHLNGQQVDLLKALAIRYTVIIPFPRSLKEKLRRSDWVSWVKDHGTTEVDLPAIDVKLKGHWISINSREISLFLNQELTPESQVVLGVSKLAPAHTDIIPSARVNFKIPHAFIETELDELSKDLEQGLSATASRADFNAWLAQKKMSILKGPFDKSMPFKRLKALQLFEEIANTLTEMTDEDIVFDVFFRKLLREVVLLNQPRTSLVPFFAHDVFVDLKDMSSLEDIDHSKKVIVCIDDRFDEIQSLGQNYTESIQKELAALGPLKRNDLDLLFKKWEFENLFAEADVTVLMPNGIFKHSLVWKKLFEHIELVSKDSGLKHPDRPLRDNFPAPKAHYTAHFSASRLQTYVDCPRKFYYQYMDKISPSVQLKKDIDSMVAGSLLHRIIEVYFERSASLHSMVHLAREVFDEHIIEHQLQIPKDVYQQRLLVFTQRATNGVNFLLKLETLVGEKISWKIEQDFSQTDEYKLVGSMDCIGECSKTLFLLDFKSTAGSAATASEVLRYDKLQLWVYSLAAQKLFESFEQKSVVIGYVVLDELHESVLLSDDADLMKSFSSEKLCSVKVLPSSMKDQLQLASEKISEVVRTITSDRHFSPNPRHQSACQYCELSKVCLKRDVNHV